MTDETTGVLINAEPTGAEMEDVTVTIGEATAPASPIVLTQVFTPDHENRATFTAALKFPQGVIAADDFAPGEFEAYRAAESATLDKAHKSGNAIRDLRIRAQNTTDEAAIKELQKSAEKHEAAINASTAEKLALWREVSERLYKGVKVGETFVNEPFPLTTAPLQRRFLEALASRAELGRSDIDFLDLP
jgi:hypothetical protein